jgi:uncharacterized membrane protein
MNTVNVDEMEMESFSFHRSLVISIVYAFLAAIISAVIGVVIWLLFDSDHYKLFDVLVPVLMVGVTLFGILGSFKENIRVTKHMNVVGQYLILVFSFSLASSMDLQQLEGMFGSTLMLYGLITVLVFILHVLISSLMKLDADITMVTLTAGLYGPAFVPAITKQIKNDSLTAPGLITGSIGYAIGTFLGAGLALLFLM